MICHKFFSLSMNTNWQQQANMKSAPKPNPVPSKAIKATTTEVWLEAVASSLHRKFSSAILLFTDNLSGIKKLRLKMIYIFLENQNGNQFCKIKEKIHCCSKSWFTRICTMALRSSNFCSPIRSIVDNIWRNLTSTRLHLCSTFRPIRGIWGLQPRPNQLTTSSNHL